MVFLFFCFIACKDADQKDKTHSENSIDAGRNFIRAALDGKFDNARKFMLPDSVNVNYMDVAERNYQRADQSTKDGYRMSSINIINVKDIVKDSITVLIYSNSFKKDPDTLKVIKSNGQWLVDLKYLYLHDADTLHPAEIINDKIK